MNSERLLAIVAELMTANLSTRQAALLREAVTIAEIQEAEPEPQRVVAKQAKPKAELRTGKEWSTGEIDSTKEWLADWVYGTAKEKRKIEKEVADELGRTPGGVKCKMKDLRDGVIK